MIRRTPDLKVGPSGGLGKNLSWIENPERVKCLLHALHQSNLLRRQFNGQVLRFCKPDPMFAADRALERDDAFEEEALRDPSLGNDHVVVELDRSDGFEGRRELAAHTPQRFALSLVARAQDLGCPRAAARA